MGLSGGKVRGYRGVHQQHDNVFCYLVLNSPASLGLLGWPIIASFLLMKSAGGLLRLVGFNDFDD